MSDELLDEFSNHFAQHPKTAGRTKTGGPFFSKKKFQDNKGPPTRLQSHLNVHREPRRKGAVQKRPPIKTSNEWVTGEPRSSPSPAPVRVQGIIGMKFAWFEMTWGICRLHSKRTQNFFVGSHHVREHCARNRAYPLTPTVTPSDEKDSLSSAQAAAWAQSKAEASSRSAAR